MKTMLAVAVAMFLYVGCGNTATNYNGDTSWMNEDTFVGDNTDNMAEPDGFAHLKEMEEWALKCGLLWPVDAWFICNLISLDEPLGPCQLDWDHESCRASCFTSTHGFDNATVEDISTKCEQTPDDGWAPGCDPPWPDGTGVTCQLDEDFIVDFCVLSWDKSSCTASCWNPNTSSNVFWDCPAEAVSTPYPNGAGCSPFY